MGRGCVKIRLLNGSPRNAVLVEDVLSIQIMPEVSEPTVKAGEDDKVNLSRPHIVEEALKIVSLEFLSGDSVVDVGIDENHVLMRVDIFLSGC